MRLGVRIASHLAPERSLRLARQRLLPRSPGLERPLRGETRRWVEHQGRRVAVYGWGDPGRPRILLAHDWARDSSVFAGWIRPLLAAGYAVTAFDQPGHGMSNGSCMPDEFVDVLRALTISMSSVDAIVAHGHGAWAATRVLAEHPLARRAVLIAPPVDPCASLVRSARELGLSAHLARQFASAHATAAAEGQPPSSIADVAAAIGCPALVVHDLCDEVVPSIDGECYARHWRDAQMLTTTGLSHESIISNVRVMRSTLEFLGGGAVGQRVTASLEIDSLLGLH